MASEGGHNQADGREERATLVRDDRYPAHSQTDELKRRWDAHGDAMFHSDHSVWDGAKTFVMMSPVGLAAGALTWWLLASGHLVWGVVAAVAALVAWAFILVAALLGHDAWLIVRAGWNDEAQEQRAKKAARKD